MVSQIFPVTSIHNEGGKVIFNIISNHQLKLSQVCCNLKQPKRPVQKLRSPGWMEDPQNVLVPIWACEMVLRDKAIVCTLKAILPYCHRFDDLYNYNY